MICAPPFAGFHGFRAVGAAAKTYRWRPAFHRTGCERGLDSHDPGPFFHRAQTLLRMFGVAHAAPVLPRAELSHRIDRSRARLLRLGEQSPGFYRSWPAKGFDGLEERPVLRPEALAEAKEAFENRASERYRRMAPVAGRLAEALARSGPFAVADRVLNVGIALERMYVLDGGQISRKLRTGCPVSRERRTGPGERQGERTGVLCRAVGHHSQPAAQAVARKGPSGVSQRLRRRAQVPVQAATRRTT